MIQFLGREFVIPPVNELLQTSLDIFVVAFLVYQFFMIIRGRRAAQVLNGIWVLLVVYLVSVWLHLELLRTILLRLAPYTALAIIVMFQSEIRRLLARIGRSRVLGFKSSFERREVTDEILLALQYLSQKKTGALIVIERDTGLRTFIESGVAMDSLVSRDLLITIFENRGPLHDGAAIIQGGRIAASACFLPLTTNPGAVGKLGTRHRAAIGVTEETDCLAILVSEESGKISVAAFGELEHGVTLERVEQRINRHAAGIREELEFGSSSDETSKVERKVPVTEGRS
jgi:diadenylate cyclase